MKKLTVAVLGAVLSTVLLAAGPAYADRGDRGGRGYQSDYRDYGHGHKHWKQARKFHHHKHQKHYVVRRDVYHHYYRAYQPEPVYYTRPAPFGVSVILPNIFIPIR